MTQDGISKKAPDYGRLDPYINQIALHMNKSYDAFKEYCRIATEEEHLTPREAWLYLESKLKDSIPRSTLYRWPDKDLPEEAKQVTKPKGQTQDQDDEEKIPWESPDADTCTDADPEEETIGSSPSSQQIVTPQETDRQRWRRQTPKFTFYNPSYDITNCLSSLLRELSGCSDRLGYGDNDIMKMESMPIPKLISESRDY